MQDDQINIGAEIIAAAARINRVTGSLEKAGRIVLVTGRGGTGKSSFTALLSRYLKSPQLLLDIDPDQSLGTMLGIDLESDQDKTEAGADSPLKTLSDLTSRIEDEDAFTELGGSPATVKIPMLLQWYTQFQSERFDLISLGPKWTAGDYRSANFLFDPGGGQPGREVPEERSMRSLQEEENTPGRIVHRCSGPLAVNPAPPMAEGYHGAS